ncbi:---NA--- [Paramuricea clavata]|nr:---NA--- [Paramuricea clavata]
MAVSHVLTVFLQISLVFLNIFYIISAKKCADIQCKGPISIAIALKDHESFGENYLRFKKGDKLTIYSKYVGGDNSVWQGSLGGTPARFLKSDFVEEKTKIVDEDKLVDLASDTEGHVKAPVNEGQLPEESQQHADEMHEEASKDESVTNSLGNPDVSSDSPVLTSSTDDHIQAEHKHPTNEDANKAAKEPPNEVADEAANEGKDNREHSQDKLTNDNERTVQDSEPVNNDPKIGDESQVPDDDNNDHQETMEDNDEGVDDRTERTRVYTDPNGVQYDMRIEYSNPQDEESNDDVKVVGAAEQEQPHSGEDDPAGKVDEDKGNGQDLNAETPGSDQETKTVKKEGFFSSIGNIVSDFTENIIKDFQGEEERSDKETNSNLEQEREDPVNSEKTEEEKADEKQDIKIDSREDGSNTKPSGFKGFQERFQQLKAARLEKMKDDTARKEASVSPAVDEEEILKREAKRTVEEIPGLMKEEKNEGGEVASEGVKNEEMISRESGDKTGSQKPTAKQYSDKVLCRSVPVENRDICMASGSREKCLKDNCCFDETAEPARQCFFKPSAPESGFTEEELQELLSDEEEKSDEGNEAAVKTDKDSSESSESEKSSIGEQADKTADVSGETKELKDVELDDGRKSETVDKSDDESENGDETKVIGTEVDADKNIDSVQKASSAVGKSESLDEVNKSSPKVSSSEKSDTAETVDSTASRKQAEGMLSEARDSDDDKQEEIDDNDPKDEMIEEKPISGSDTSKDDAIIDTQESSDVSIDSSNETASVDSKEKLQDESDDEGVSGLSTSGSSASIEKEESLMGGVTESGEVDGQDKEVRSVHDSEDDTSSVSSTKENGGSSAEGKGVSADATSKDKIQEEVGAIDKDSESVERKDEVDEEGESEHKVQDEGGDETRNPSDSEDEMKSSANDSKSETTSREEPAGREGVSDEDKSEQEPETESNGITDRQGETQDSQDNPIDATLIDEMVEENEEILSEDNVNEKKEDQPDTQGIFASLKKFLPGGGSTEEENTKSKEETSDEILDVNKIKVPEKVEKVNAEGDQGKVKDDTQERRKDSESSENVKEDQADLKSEQVQEGGETNVKEASIEEESDKDVDDDDKEMAEELLADILEDESLSMEDATDSETIISETTVKQDSENSVESGSTHFLNNTEATLPVEKTLDKELEVNDSTSQGGDDMKTGIKETETGVEETKTGLEGTESVEETRIEPDIVPSKTSAIGSSETSTTGHRPFEKKFPKIASKWMENKLMKGKRMAEKDTEEGTSDMNGNVDSEKVDKEQHAGNMDGSLGSGASDKEDPHSGTCAKDGTCEGTNTFSSSTHRSILENDKDHDDDDIVEPSPPDEEPEVKSVKAQFREILAVAVKNFREYHNLAAEYGLQMLKPVKNVVKSLGEQMGLGESIDYVEQEMKQGPQGVIAVTLILIAFAAYFMLSVLCGGKVPPAYGPNLKDIFKTYEGRIRILEEECSGYEEKINNLKNKADEHGENSSALEKQLDDEKHERNKSDKQISILKEIVQNYKEKVELLEEESSKLKQSLDQRTERINTMEEQLSEKSNEIETTEEKINKLEEQLKEKDEEKSELNGKIDEFKQQLSKAEDDTDRVGKY